MKKRCNVIFPNYPLSASARGGITNWNKWPVFSFITNWNILPENTLLSSSARAGITNSNSYYFVADIPNNNSPLKGGIGICVVIPNTNRRHEDHS